MAEETGLFKKLASVIGDGIDPGKGCDVASAEKQDSRLAIATIALSDPKSAGMRLRELLLGTTEVFNLAIQ